jgi:hypothetical protein
VENTSNPPNWGANRTIGLSRADLERSDAYDRGRAVATVRSASVRNILPAGALDRTPDRHPLKTFICFLALYARDVLTGELAGNPWRYEPAYGERYARDALIPAREFRALAHRSDRWLAARFVVPVDQIARRRRDVAVCPLRDIARSRRRGYRRSDPRTSRSRTGC